MPSRPMLIVPLRSATRPASPARPIGCRGAQRDAERAARGEVVGVGEDPRERQDGQRSDHQRRAATSATMRQPTVGRRVADGGGGESVAMVMPALPRSDRRPAVVAPSASVVVPVAAAAALAAAAVVPPVDHLVGDHGGEQERALQDLPISWRDPDRPQPLRRPFDRRPHDRGCGDADRVVAAEQREAEAGEADRRRERVAVLVEVRVGEEVRQPDHAGDGAGHEQRDQHHPLRVDAGRPGGRRGSDPTRAARSRTGCG